MVTRNGARVVVNRTRASRLRASREDRKGSSRLQVGEVPSLKEFVHRQNVRRQYRGFLRALDSISDSKFRKQGREEVRKEFGALKFITDQLAISMAIKEGARKLKELRSIVGYQKEEEHADSWLNIQDDEDPRGRVGVSWPWEK